ncbi:hypothetical protein [Bradyrhizobium sp. dw_78]|uniref:hypothetical protein n=1 Tax=Bradyrhizobium sp. dw_78 TaxID=2719793 RepID=UPI001BD6127B|nr:hypothetical protein [Bradyrhizobium sp. dw_78]
MLSTLDRQENDPRDIPEIAPDVVLAARADKGFPTLAPEIVSRPSGPQTQTGPGASASSVDTAFRATAADHIQVPGPRSAMGRRASRAFMGFVFTLCSAVAAIAWEHYGDAAQQTIADWTPQLALISSLPEKLGLAGQSSPPAAPASAADPAPSPAAQSAEATVPAAALSPDTAQLLQSMAHDLATMGQQIAELRASLDQLKSGQEQIARDMARTAQARVAEARVTEAKAAEPNLRSRISPLPPRPAATPVHKPKPAFAPAQAAVASPLPPAQTSTPRVAPPQAAATPAPAAAQATAQPAGDPALRPPMPLR